ncbi:hypothetical protein GIB67_014501 [Kingdonia uniflora]|uniref:No apical meristem-associated C-terminal domain-containing protein n=1 Tax=Kingdonia uniflora TaxID=39325 RepID=A0A7J7LZ51_9MAGN|nr:hypothetical protein GIB67_014501 [Kingdonia uniflora]
MASFSRILFRTFCTSPLLRLRPSRPLLRNFLEEKDLTKLVEKFKESSELEGFRNTATNLYKHTVNRLASARQFSSIEEILELQKKYKDISREGFAVRIISLYGKAGMLDHALKTFEELPEFKCNCTIKCVNVLLSAYVDCKKYDEVEPLMRQLMTKFELTPDIYSYNIVIGAFFQRGNFDEAVAMLDEMEKNGVEPNLITYFIILNNLYSKSELFLEGEEIWSRMEKSGLAPDIRCYNSKLKGLVVTGKMSEAVKLVEELENNAGMKPDVFTYNTLIKGYCNDGNLDEAKRVFDALVKKKSTNRHSFCDIVHCLCEKGGLDTALEMCNVGLGTKGSVNVGSVQAVMDGLIKESRIQEAKKLVELAKSKSPIFSHLEIPSASRKSGENLSEDGKIKKAKIMYKKIEKKEFKLVRSWKELRLHKKWQDYVEKTNDQLRPQSSTSSRRRNSSNNSSPTTDLNEDDDEVVSPNKNQRPRGRKTGKELRRRKGTNYEIPGISELSELIGSYIEDRKNVHERKLKLQEFEHDERIMRINITDDMDEMTKLFYEQEKKNIMARRSLFP